MRLVGENSGCNPIVPEFQCGPVGSTRYPLICARRSNLRCILLLVIWRFLGGQAAANHRCATLSALPSPGKRSYPMVPADRQHPIQPPHNPNGRKGSCLAQDPVGTIFNPGLPTTLRRAVSSRHTTTTLPFALSANSTRQKSRASPALRVWWRPPLMRRKPTPPTIVSRSPVDTPHPVAENTNPGHRRCAIYY